MTGRLELVLAAPLVAATLAAAVAEARWQQRRLAAIEVAHDAAFAGTCAGARAVLAARGTALGGLRAARVSTSGAAPDRLLTVALDLGEAPAWFATAPLTAGATVRLPDQAAPDCEAPR